MSRLIAFLIDKDASFNVSLTHNINTCILLASNLVPRARVNLV